MNSLTLYEYDALTFPAPGLQEGGGLRIVPPKVYEWLELQALRAAEPDEAGSPWLRLTQRRGRRAVQVTSYVGVIRTPDGFQIEVLPKVGKAIGGGDNEARELLIEMLRCLGGFRHIQTDSAKLKATRMPLLEVFIAEFLQTAEHVVKRGLRSDYNTRQDNLFALRGKLQLASHLRQNLCRRDRFFTEHDEFSTNRPENRLLHAALRWVLSATTSQANQQLARELCFAFSDVPVSGQVARDFQRVRLILEEASPLTGDGGHRAPSLLFPMEAVFEAFVAKHLARQLERPFVLKTQARSFCLVRHQGQDWFRLKPDLLVRESATERLVLDTKWKLIDGAKANGSEKYGLGQDDFYQLHAYGQSYLDGQGNVVLIYPKTDAFSLPLPVFEFPKSAGLRLWVLPFCLRDKRLLLPQCGSLDALFMTTSRSDSVVRNSRISASADRVQMTIGSS
ncbi:McrC family protein [Burkholderia vietnamiensis]|uniref:McrC family protein n=1 Tax=Burkholderia vietnamiensis TaxID=60552 RepID=UPI001CF493D1|nr:McrC family protein [Burkholderia vietnamiensis]MCA7988461.1 McrC family protein [Burkholderia vietnamiensis]